MLSIHSPRHGSRVLLSERRIRAVHHTDDGIVLEVEGHDGERMLLVTGRVLDDLPAAERVARARRAIATVRGSAGPVPAPTAAPVAAAGDHALCA
ncbi:MAG TPA: hypothetical protein VM367_08285 [Pseudonocardia sp.]|jgi:hypothetical protein|nr:hypothetical protein [Pseudonocardia sp.]